MTNTLTRYLLILICLIPGVAFAAGGGGGHGGEVQWGVKEIAPSLDKYETAEAAQGIDSVGGKLINRIKSNPFHLVASIIFLLAVLHTFMAGFFQKLAHQVEEKHRQEIQEKGRTADRKPYHNAKDDHSFMATLYHFLGEIEAIFGI